MKTEEMREMAADFDKRANNDMLAVDIRLAYRQRCTTALVGVEICERLDRLIELGEKQDGS